MNSNLSAIVFDTKNGQTSVHSACQVQASVLRSMFENDSMHDVTLCGVPATGQKLTSLCPIRAYKIVLAHASSHLHDLFTSDEYVDSLQSHYNIENIDHDALRRIVEFIHTDKITIDEKDAVDVACSVLIGAKYLVLKNQLADACENFLAKPQQVKPDNCIKLWRFARKYSCLTLMEVTSNFIAKNLADMPKNDAFLKMPYSDCAKLLLSEAFVTANADGRCQAAIAWLSYGYAEQKNGREKHVSDILNMIPFTGEPLSVETILMADGNEVLKARIRDSIYVAAINTLKNIKSSQKASLPVVAAPVVVQRNLVVPGGTYSKPSYHKWFLTGNLVGDDTDSQFLQYDVDKRTWSTLPNLPWKRTHTSAVCAVNNRIVVMGGYKNGAISHDIDEYDLSSGLWLKSNAHLCKARDCLVGCADYHNTAYALGGCESDVAESYVVGASSFFTTKLADMRLNRFHSAASFCAAHNFIVVAGGCSKFASRTEVTLHNIGKYDIFFNRWSTIGRMTQPRSGLASVFAGSGDDLYLIGGSDMHTLDDVEILNVCSGKTRAAPNLLKARDGCSATTINEGSVVVVLGDVDGSRAVETYDVREGKWSTGVVVPDMPVSSAFFGFAAV